jgi:phosphoserine aminotransferase
MKRIFNFSAGPCTLPVSALEQARDEMVEFQGQGMSLIEMSHRSKTYDQIHHEAMSLVTELLGLPSNYKVLLLGGGATLQFSMVPMNLLHGGKSCDFTLTGAWAKKALSDAKKVGKVNVVFDGTDKNFTAMPDPASIKASSDAAYLHLTSNETIGGIGWQGWPDTGNVPLVADMSSDFMSRPVPVDKFGLIYAGAQKNVGPAGLAVVIIRDDVLASCSPDLTSYLSYPNHAKADSMMNTPPVFTIYMMKLVLERLRDAGGLDAAAQLAKKRSDLLYDVIESLGSFYNCPVDAASRSKMNIVFRLPTEELEKQFVAEALAKDMSGLKGHRSVGGCRASMYNAMPVEGAETLVKFMVEFAKKNG